MRLPQPPTQRQGETRLKSKTRLDMTKESRKKQPRPGYSLDLLLRWIVLAVVLGLFLILLYPNLVIQPHVYQLGDIAERDIKTQKDFFVEDREATRESIKQAVQAVLTVYDYDPRISGQVAVKVRGAFDEMQSTIGRPGPVPSPQTPAAENPDQPEKDGSPAQSQADELQADKDNFENRIGLPISQGAFELLIEERFSEQIAELIIKITQGILNNGVVANKEILLKESEKGIILRNVASQSERQVTGLRKYYGPDQAKTMVRIVAEPLVKDMNYNLVNLVVDFCQRLIQPNITVNRNETEERKKRAAAEIKPVLYKIKAGEMILREGERVSHVHMLKLQAMRNQADDKKITTTGLGAASMLAVLLIMLYCVYRHHASKRLLGQARNLLFLGLMLAMVFIIVKMGGTFITGLLANTSLAIPDSSIVYAIPSAAAAMLVCLFLGFDIVIPFSLLAALCTALLLNERFDQFIFFFINNTMAAHWVRQCRERRLYIIAAAKLGLLNMVVATAAGIYTFNYSGITLLWDWTFAFCGGIASGIITLGMAPLMELGFHYTTDISLLELSNLDRPLLRRLMLEAPGTYHHSVIVGSLAESAATEIGANPLLCKVCGYYHDIGKIKKPLYFIENQKSGRNKHDKLAPSMSSLILIAHIKDGIDIARKYKLGQDIVDTISQHHGTSLISYFYNKAKQLKGEDAVKIDNFRYPGPKPQTKEAGLVMLADVVEAASRTLENPTPARIQGLVQELINKVFSDGQLDNCELTLKDLHSIAKSFNKILYGIHHHRIEYTDSPARENGKGKNGSTDRQSTAKVSDRDQGHSKESTGHLRRLGLS